MICIALNRTNVDFKVLRCDKSFTKITQITIPFITYYFTVSFIVDTLRQQQQQLLLLLLLLLFIVKPTVDMSLSEVHLCIKSAMLIRTVFGIGSASIHRPSRLCTCNARFISSIGRLNLPEKVYHPAHVRSPLSLSPLSPAITLSLIHI